MEPCRGHLSGPTAPNLLHLKESEPQDIGLNCILKGARQLFRFGRLCYV
jgi:hypothetical protein